MTKPTTPTVEYEGREHPVRFLHDRPRKEDGTFETNGGLTKAYIVLEKDETGRPTRILDEVADCDKRDAFNKKLGRRIALGRLKLRLTDPKWWEIRKSRRRQTDVITQLGGE